MGTITATILPWIVLIVLISLCIFGIYMLIKAIRKSNVQLWYNKKEGVILWE